MKLLLHACCAPCSGAIIEALVKEGIKPTVFWSNSNIYDKEEYEKRRAELLRYAKLFDLTVVDDDYDHSCWQKSVASGRENAPERGDRCLECFRFRLARAARYASENGFDTLATTLASSRWKSLEQVNEAGEWACSQVQGVNWWGRNWRKGGLQPRRNEIIKEQNFYNQTFCGCEYSTSMKKTVLVSGGAGFIGSHVTVELVQAGYDVLIADNFSNCDETNYKGVCAILGKQMPLVKMDFCDAKAADKLFAENKIDAVIHFAAFKAVGESVAKPLMYYKNNLESFMNVLEAAQAHGCTNVLFSSSATVYGEPDVVPVTEESPRKPATSPYGNTKQMCEDILQDSVRASEGKLHGILLRYFNPIGAHPTALIGELPRGIPNNLVPFITQTAIGKRECLSIFGNDYPTEDGTCKRDYIDIVDLAKAHVYAVRRMLDGKMKQGCEVFNVGTGRPVSVLELVNAFEKVNNLKLNWKFAPRRAGDVTAIWADPTLANKELGWKAERSVEETLAAAWAWEKRLAGK